MFTPARQLVNNLFGIALFDAALLELGFAKSGSSRLMILRGKRFRINMDAIVAAASGTYLK